MPDFSISDMPWLTQPADPVRSFSAGAAVGAQIAQNRAQRQSLAQRRYEFEQARQLQQRDQSLQERLAPLQEQALRMQNDLGTYKLDELKRQLTMREANAKIVNEVGGLVLQSVLSGQAADPQSVAAVADLVSRAPNKNDPELLKWLDVYNEGVKAQHAVKQQFQPGFGTGTNPITGQSQAFFRTGPNSAQLVEGRAGVAPELQRLVEWIESRKGEKLSDEEITQLFEVQQGLKPRAAITQPDISEPNFIARELPKLRAAEIAGELSPKKRRSDDQLREELRRQYREIYKKESTEPPTASAPFPDLRLIEVKDASGKIVGRIRDTPTQRKLANDKGLILVQ